MDLLTQKKFALGSELLENHSNQREKAECPLWSLLTTSLERRAVAVASHNEAPTVAGRGGGEEAAASLCALLPILDYFLVTGGLAD